MGRQLAIVYGVVYLAVGILGLFDNGLSQEPSDLLGLFRVNGLHDIVHLVIGVAGIAAYVAGETASIGYAKVFGIILLLVGLVGFFDPFPDVLPLGGADIALHLITGALAAYVGFASSPTRAAPSA